MVAQANPPKSLTHKEETFAQAIASGKSAAEAYRIAYSAAGFTNTALRVEAWRVSNREHVVARVRQLQEQLSERMVLSRSRKRHILFEIAEKKSNKPGDRVKAIEVDNRMTGDEAPVKIEGELTLGVVLGSIKQVQPIVELTQEPHGLVSAPPVQMLEESEIAQVETQETEVSAPPAIPADSGPFAGEVAVFPITYEPTPQKLTRTRSYDE